MTTVRQVPVPRASRLCGAYLASHLADAYEVSLPDEADQAPWLTALMRLRDTIVAPFSIFKVISRHENEIVFGQVFILPTDSTHPHRRLLAVTVVQCHNLLGRTYISLIAPFHRMIVASGLRRAGKFGWPPFFQIK